MSKALNGIVQLVSEQINSEILISTQTENIIDQFMNKSFFDEMASWMQVWFTHV